MMRILHQHAPGIDEFVVCVFFWCFVVIFVNTHQPLYWWNLVLSLLHQNYLNYLDTTFSLLIQF